MRGYKFPNPTIIRAQGKHARRYLQNRLTNNIAALAPGTHCLTAALTSQGKIEFYGWCYCENDTSFMLCASGGDALGAMQALSRFKVTEQVDFVHFPNASLTHLCDTTEPPNSPTPYLTITAPRVAQTGIDIITFESALELKFEPLNDADFYKLRFEFNYPIFPEEIGTDMLLPEIGKTDAVSFTKGCYVGQEVVAKIDSLGRPPRLIRRVEAQNVMGLLRGQKLENSQGRPIGEIRSWLENDRIGFALLKNDDSIQECFAVGVALRTL